MAGGPISIVIPAHNEAGVIGRLLQNLQHGARADDEIIVVCNGCTDRTVEIARTHPGVQVVELAERGKPLALNAGDDRTTVFPRFYVDADIQVTSAALHAVSAALCNGVEAGAPRPVFDTSRSSVLVRAYYRFWSRLPYLTSSPLGSGVFGLTDSGRRRFQRFPPIIADDEFVRRHFAAHERLGSCSDSFLVTAPRTLGALIRIKTRSRLGVLQLDRLLGPLERTVHTGHPRRAPAVLSSPSLWFPCVVYSATRLVIEVLAQVRHRRSDYSSWARDHSSRAP